MDTAKPKTLVRFDFAPGAGPDEIAAAVREVGHKLLAEKAKVDAAADAQDASTLALVWEATTQSLSDAAEAISDAGAAIADKAADIGTAGIEMTAGTAKHIAQASSAAFEYLDDAVDHHAIKDAIVDAAEAVGDRLDQVTGKKLVELLEAKLRRQDEYNDILATRLAEALQRIAAIEKRLSK